MKKLLIILLIFAFSLGTIYLTSDSGMKDNSSNAVITIATEEVTVNNPEDIKEYIVGVKP
jgi:uncharacterized membrane protein